MAHAKKRIRLKVASPCKVDWDQMEGDDAVRFCGQCKKNVYQLSNLTTEQIEELLNVPGEKRCVRFYQRADGTVLTGDCTVGARRRRRKQALFALGAGVLSAFGYGAIPGDAPAPPAQVMPARAESAGRSATSSKEPALHEVQPQPLMGEPAPVEVLQGDVAAIDVEE